MGRPEMAGMRGGPGGNLREAWRHNGGPLECRIYYSRWAFFMIVGDTGIFPILMSLLEPGPTRDNTIRSSVASDSEQHCPTFCFSSRLIDASTPLQTIHNTYAEP